METWRVIIIVSTLSTFSVSITTQSVCLRHHDFSERMFLSDVMVSAKVKAVFRSRQSENVKYRLRISEVYKDITNKINPKQKISVLQSLSCNNETTSVKLNGKYFFTMSTKYRNLELTGPVEKSNKRNRRVIKKLLCNGCGKGPTIKKPKRKSTSVKMYRWRGLKCRLDSGTQPLVTFSWIYHNRTLTISDNYKIRSKRSGSVLNIRGLPDTAGVYTCLAQSLAGSDRMETTLYVHGDTVATVCRPSAG